jgi:hypothetical protein
MKSPQKNAAVVAPKRRFDAPRKRKGAKKDSSLRSLRSLVAMIFSTPTPAPPLQVKP